MKEARQMETTHEQGNIDGIEDSYEELAIPREKIDQVEKTRGNIISKQHGTNITLEESTGNIENKENSFTKRNKINTHWRKKLIKRESNNQPLIK